MGHTFIYYATVDPDTGLRKGTLAKIETAHLTSEIPSSIVAGFYKFKVIAKKLLGIQEVETLNWEGFISNMEASVD